MHALKLECHQGSPGCNLHVTHGVNSRSHEYIGLCNGSEVSVIRILFTKQIFQGYHLSQFVSEIGTRTGYLETVENFVDISSNEVISMASGTVF